MEAHTFLQFWVLIPLNPSRITNLGCSELPILFGKHPLVSMKPCCLPKQNKALGFTLLRVSVQLSLNYNHECDSCAIGSSTDPGPLPSPLHLVGICAGCRLWQLYEGMPLAPATISQAGPCVQIQGLEYPQPWALLTGPEAPCSHSHLHLTSLENWQPMKLYLFPRWAVSFTECLKEKNWIICFEVRHARSNLLQSPPCPPVSLLPTFPRNVILWIKRKCMGKNFWRHKTKQMTGSQCQSFTVASLFLLLPRSQLFNDCCICSVAKSCLSLGDPVDYSMPSFPVLHYLQEFAQTHVHWVGDTIQPCHPL